MNTFLGVDGGGSKTEFVLIDGGGTLLSRHQEGTAYYLEIGLAALRALLARGIRASLRQAGRRSDELSHAFIGIPAYGEDSRLLEEFDSMPAPPLTPGRYTCGNDMVCGWAGALAGRDGISVVAGTGTIAYGEYRGRSARAGGWGELFGDEGSAYWIAREGLALFSRMSDGRTPIGPLHRRIREHFGIEFDLDLCGAVQGMDPTARSRIASLAPLVAEAARDGDLQAAGIFAEGARQIAAIVHAVRDRLDVPAGEAIPTSYSGGLFQLHDLVREPVRQLLDGGSRSYGFIEPRLPPGAGAALQAARVFGAPLDEAAIRRLEGQL